MKRKMRGFIRMVLAILVSSILCFVMAACKKDDPPPHIPPDLSQVGWNDMTIFTEGLISGEQELGEQLEGASIYHLDFQVSKDYSELSGNLSVSYTNREETPLSEVYFRLYPNYSNGHISVSNININDQAATSEITYQESALRVDLPMSLVPGKQVEITMDFDVTIPIEMGGNYGLFGYFEDILVLDSFYPVIPVYDGLGWNVDVPPRNGDHTFYDASFYIVKASIPKKMVVAASGVEIGREYEKKLQVLTFATGPARDFYLAGAEDFSFSSRQVGDTTVNSYSLDDQTEHGEIALDISEEAVEIFNQRFGQYPYTELDVVSTPMQALGIEYPGIVGISTRLYDPDEEVSGLPSVILLESVIAHEVAHQWFYNVVGSDQVNEPWVDEALTQYATGLYFVDAYGDEAAQSYRSSWRDLWGRIGKTEIPIGYPSATYEPDQYAPIVYGRGPIFLSALEDAIGQDTMDIVFRDYVERHWWGIGTGQSFLDSAERGCSCELDSLWKEWVDAN